MDFKIDDDPNTNVIFLKLCLNTFIVYTVLKENLKF